MVQKIAPLLLFLIVPSILTSAPRHSSRVNAKDLIVPILTGDEPLPTPIPFPSYPIGNSHDEIDIIGDTVVIGTTWCESQHNGSCGRMLAISDNGLIHFSWMKGYNEQNDPRHIWYNAYDLVNNVLVFPAGMPIDGSLRAGFCTLDVSYSVLPFIAFHQLLGYPDYPQLAIWCPDGIFSPEPWFLDSYISPRLMFDHTPEPTMHIVGTEYVANAGDPFPHWYTPARYDSLAHTIHFPTPPDSALWAFPERISASGTTTSWC
jgi:hypothetical protein